MNSGDDFRGRVEVTFLKWVSDWGNMAGVVSGDVGGGTFAGETLSSAIRAPLLGSRLFTTSTAGPSNLPRTTM